MQYYEPHIKIIGSALCLSCSWIPTLAEESTSDSPTGTESLSANSFAQNADIWKYKRKFMVGYTSGTLDRKKRFGGEISSRWGVSVITGRNIYLHRKPIGGFLRFGLNIDMNLNYMNFAKGSGKLSDIMHPGDNDDDMGMSSLGRHYLTAGLSVGPTASFAPFYSSANRKLASLIFRPYFSCSSFICNLYHFGR